MYSDTLKEMTKAQLLEEAAKYDNIEKIVSKDSKDDIIMKILIARANGPSTYEQLASANVVTPGSTMEMRDLDVIGTRGPVDEMDLLTVQEKDYRTLLENYQRQNTPLVATLTSYIKTEKEINGSNVFIQAIFGESQKQILIPLSEYKLEVRSVVTKLLKSEKANSVNSKANKNIRFDQMTDQEIRSYLNKRPLSKLNFMVVEIDDDPSGYVVASRVEAAKKDQLMWNKRVSVSSDGSGMWLLRDGKKIQAEIVSVESYGVYVEIFGYEFFVPKAELTYRGRANTKQLYSPGQKILLKLKNVTRDAKGDFQTAALSAIDLLKEDPAKEIVRGLSPKQTVYGHIIDMEFTQKSGYLYYVQYAGCVDICCVLDKRITIKPNVGDFVAVKIKDPNVELGKARGYILHIYPSFSQAPSESSPGGSW